MKTLGVGIIGTGFMGKAHAFAYHAAPVTFPHVPRVVLQAIADVNAPAAEKLHAQFGFKQWHSDWRKLIDDPAIDIISITTPNTLHKEMALAAAKAGKHIHCEKPLAPSAAEAQEMMQAAEAAGVKTQVGYNYIKNPVLNWPAR